MEQLKFLATLENNMEIYYKVKHTLTLWPAYNPSLNSSKHVYLKICIQVFIVALFLISPMLERFHMSIFSPRLIEMSLTYNIV